MRSTRNAALARQKDAGSFLIAALVIITAALLATAVAGCQSSRPSGSGTGDGKPSPVGAASAPQKPDRVEHLPLLTEQLSGQTIRLFRTALRKSGLWQKLEKEGPFTVLAPVDQAMESIIDVSLDELSPAALKQLVSSHLVMGRFLVQDLMEREQLEALNGRVLRVELTNGKLRIDQSRLLWKNIEARNGVIHYIYPALAPQGRGGRE